MSMTRIMKCSTSTKDEQANQANSQPARFEQPLTRSFIQFKTARAKCHVYEQAMVGR